MAFAAGWVAGLTVVTTVVVRLASGAGDPPERGGHRRQLALAAIGVGFLAWPPASGRSGRERRGGR